MDRFKLFLILLIGGTIMAMLGFANGNTVIGILGVVAVAASFALKIYDDIEVDDEARFHYSGLAVFLSSSCFAF